MAEDSELDRILRPYAGPQEADPGPDEVYSTADVLRRMRKANPVSSAMRAAAHYIPAYDDPEMRRGDTEGWPEWWARTNHQGSLPNFLMQAARGGLNSSANWLDGKPEVGPDTLAPLGAAGVGAVAARHAAPRPSLPAESAVDKLSRWGKATALHQRSEMKRGNPSGFPEGLAAFGLSTAAALNGWPALGSAGMILTHPRSVLMSPHFDNISNIARYLREMELREAGKHPPPDNSGFALYAENDLANAPGILVNAAEQRPTAGTTPKSLRQGALEEGRRGFHELEPDMGIGHFPEGPRYSPEHTFYALSALKDAGWDLNRALRSTGHPATREVLQSWSDAGIDPLRAKRYWRGQEQMADLEPPTRALSQDAKGRYYDKNRMNADIGFPGAFATPQQNLDLEDLLKQYRSQF